MQLFAIYEFRPLSDLTTEITIMNKTGTAVNKVKSLLKS